MSEQSTDPTMRADVPKKYTVQDPYEDWRTLRFHRPGGAYLPTGTLEGDCVGCHYAWPCDPAIAALATYGFHRSQGRAAAEQVVTRG